MAYRVYLYSVTPSAVQAFRESQSAPLNFTQLATCSHMLRHWSLIFEEAIVGGEIFHPNLTHPFRPPTIHSIDAVIGLQSKLVQEWEAVSQDESWDREQIEKVVKLFNWAQAHQQTVISSLGALHSE